LLKPITDSCPNRSAIPVQTDHRFSLKSISHSCSNRSLIPV